MHCKDCWQSEERKCPQQAAHRLGGQVQMFKKEKQIREKEKQPVQEEVQKKSEQAQQEEVVINLTTLPDEPAPAAPATLANALEEALTQMDRLQNLEKEKASRWPGVQTRLSGGVNLPKKSSGIVSAGF